MKVLLRNALNLLPYGSFFDRIFLLTLFVYAHRRIPSRTSMLMNDYLYFLKASPSILDVYRQITSDKIAVKGFVRDVCGGGITLDTIAIFESVDEIDIDSLPKPCVIKPAHGSGSVVFIHKEQTTLPTRDRQTLTDALRSSPYTTAREANYKYLRRRLICEPMLPDGALTKDYKFFCYRGEPRLIQVDSERHCNHKRTIYTTDWQRTKLEYNFPVAEQENRPTNLQDMLSVARLLAKPFEFVRVDFFVSGNEFFVGELTHCPESAHGRFGDRASEKEFSRLLFGTV